MRCRLMITADGDRALFPQVTRVVKAAPAIPGWSVIAFRQRAPLAGKSITMDGVSIDLDRARIDVHRAGERLDVALYLPGFTPGNETIQRIGLIALDNAVGEYDMETRIGAIDWYPLTQAPSFARPLPELPAILDATFPRAHRSRGAARCT